MIRFPSDRTYIVGVLNLTPDSFSDGGKFVGTEAALAHARRLVSEGADLIDVGGESTRPGAPPVDEASECARVVPIIEAIVRAQLGAPISIDTCKSVVAEAALAAGAELVNDVSGGRDPEMFPLCGQRQVPVVIGHLRGEPRSMQEQIAFADVFEEVASELGAAIACARQSGVDQIIADPGIGFGKRIEHNLILLRRVGDLGKRLGVPVMVGPSRKAFIGELTGRPVGDRLGGTIGAAVAAGLAGADYLRVHDVGAVRDALRVAVAIRRGRA